MDERRGREQEGSTHIGFLKPAGIGGNTRNTIVSRKGG